MRQLSRSARDGLRVLRELGRRRFCSPAVNRSGQLRLPLGFFLEAFWSVFWSDRLALLRYLRQPHGAPIPSAAKEFCKINSFTEFPAAFTCLAKMLERPESRPAPAQVEFLRSLEDRKTRYQGTVPPRDYLFLAAFISIVAPRRVIEIGTLTGFSAAIIASALSTHASHDGAALVDTIDVRSQCLIDESRPTGFEITESFADLSRFIRVHAPRDSAFVSELACPGELEVAFIDAHHGHPMPLLDLLRVAPYMQSGAWILLHDIQLGTLGRKRAKTVSELAWSAPFGAEWLFNYWPYRKISGGNIGAVQLPQNKVELISFAVSLMSLPFEVKDSKVVRRNLYKSLAELIN